MSWRSWRIQKLSSEQRAYVVGKFGGNAGVSLVGAKGVSVVAKQTARAVVRATPQAMEAISNERGSIAIGKNNSDKTTQGTGEIKRHPDGSLRDSKGRFAGKTGTVPGTPGVDKAKQIIQTDPKYKGYEILSTEISVKSADGTLRRYDIVARKPDGTIVGIEVKSGTATRTPQQRAIDEELNKTGGLPTTGQKARNAGIEKIDTVELIKVK